jgi:hypothetical protein
MGCCTVKNNKVSNQEDSLNKKVSKLMKLREDVLLNILSLHSLSLECKHAFEKCVLDQNKAIGRLILQKQSVVNAKILNLQNLIGTLDRLLEGVIVSRREKKKLKSVVKAILLELNSILFTNDLNKIKESDKEYINNLKKAITAYSINETEIDEKINLEYSKSLNLTNRKRYSRRKNIQKSE